MPLSGISVLLAEDNPTNQMVAMQMLDALGAEVTLAVDGAEALAILESRVFDVALIDMEMPHVSGLEVIRRLRAAGGPAARMPMVALTAHIGDAQRVEIEAAGADDTISKPILSITAFGQAIAEHVRPRHGRRAASGAGEPGAGIDRDAFERLRASFDPGARSTFLSQVAEDIAGARAILRGAIPARDLREIRSATHVLVSVAGTVGAVRLLDLAQRLNSAGQVGNAASLDTDGAALLDEAQRVAEFVRRG